MSIIVVWCLLIGPHISLARGDYEFDALKGWKQEGSNLDVTMRCVRDLGNDEYIMCGKYPFNIGTQEVPVWRYHFYLQKMELDEGRFDNIWFKSWYFGDDYAEALMCEKTSDGGYILIGNTGDGTDDDWRTVVLKTDSNGDEEWRKIFGFQEDYFFGHSVREFSDGNFVIAGWKYSNHQGCSSDLFVYKLNSETGDMIYPFATEYHNPNFGTERGGFIEQTIDGGYILLGETYGEDVNGTISALWLIKRQGGTDWNKVIDTKDTAAFAPVAASVHQTDDGGYIVLGNIRDDLGEYTQVWLIKTDDEGEIEWDTKFDPDESHEDYIGTWVEQQDDDGYITCGYQVDEYGDTEIKLVKTNSDGDVSWSESIDYVDNGKAYFVQKYPNNNNKCLLAGEHDEQGGGSDGCGFIGILRHY